MLQNAPSRHRRDRPAAAFSLRPDFVVSSVERKPRLSVKPRSVGGELHFTKVFEKVKRDAPCNSNRKAPLSLLYWNALRVPTPQGIVILEHSLKVFSPDRLSVLA